MKSISTHTQLIKSEATRLGFDFCGISKADFLEEEAPRLEKWLLQNMHGKMKYMENYFDKRLDPRKLVDGAKSVISLLYNYYPSPAPPPPEGGSPVTQSDKGVREDLNAEKPSLREGLGGLSKYAYGKDYHVVIKEKLKELLHFMNEQIGEVNGRCFVDSAPVLEKAWAKKSGLGWVGKNTNLITKENGSFFFIAELIVDIDLDCDGPIEDYCGTCTKCIDACPTDAIVKPYMVDGSKCISYFTIELKEEIPVEMKGKFDGWAFGCDVCQDVCPWNRFSKPHRETQFEPNDALKGMTKKDWQEITSEVFQKVFKNSAVKRTGYEGLKRNLKFLESK